MKRKLEVYEDTDLHPDHVRKIAKDLGVSEAEVISMNRRMMLGGDASLNVPLGEEGASQWVDVLPDERPLQDETIAEMEESALRGNMLSAAMDALNDRERHILIQRRLVDEPRSLAELSEVYGVSRERIRQIEVRAFEKVQKMVHRMAHEPMPLAA